MTTKTTVTLISLLLFLVFALTTFSGIYLMYTAVSKPPRQSQASASRLQFKVGKDGIEVEITSAVAGVVITAFGIVGLLLLLRKVPVREVLGYRTHGDGDHINYMGLLTTTPILSKEEIQMPLLVWWVVKKKNRFVRSDVNK